MKSMNYVVGQVLNAATVTVDVAQTKPPPRYTEDALMDDMIGAHKFAANPSDRELLKSIAGIGTSRTRGVIIKNFIARDFLVRKKVGKLYEIRCSAAGKAVLLALPAAIKDVALTAKWERALVMVRSGQAKPEQLLEKINMMLKDLMIRLLATGTGPGKF